MHLIYRQSLFLISDEKKVRWVLLITSLTSSGFIAVQFFWMVNAYRLNEENFNKTASLALQRSIDGYHLKHSGFIFPGRTNHSLSIFSTDTVRIKAGDPNYQKLLEQFKKQVPSLKTASKSVKINLDTCGKPKAYLSRQTAFRYFSLFAIINATMLLF